MTNLLTTTQMATMSILFQPKGDNTSHETLMRRAEERLTRIAEYSSREVTAASTGFTSTEWFEMREAYDNRFETVTQAPSEWDTRPGFAKGYGRPGY